MFTCKAVVNGETYLADHLSANDYYCEKEQVQGEWVGKGAASLGLEGKAILSDDRAFESLRENRHPETSERLTQRDSRKIAFYDFQCSAPKSVSILAVTFGDDRLRDAHRESVKQALAELEKHAARRFRTGAAVLSDESVTTGNLCTAMFHHDASRALDAQLHTHCVTLNATVDGEKWFALSNREMFDVIGFAGRVYQNELALRVQKLGYALVEDRRDGVVHGFQIAGISEDQMERQSVRRQQIDDGIEDFVAQKGRQPTWREIDIITRETRGHKMLEISTDEVRSRQRSRYDVAEQAHLEHLVRHARSGVSSTGNPRGHEGDAIRFATEHVFERKTVATQAQLIEVALRENLGRVALDSLRQTIAAHADLLDLRKGRRSRPPDAASLSTVQQLERELRSVAWVNSQLDRFAPLAAAAAVSSDLGADQRAAVALLLQSRDGVTALRGPAGSGKTTTLRALDAGLKAAGRKTIYVTPTHQAKEILRGDGFAGAETIAMFLLEQSRRKEDLRDAVLVVDEAGMLSSRQGDELQAAAQRLGCRVILVGDEKQLRSVEAGDWLATLRAHSRLRVAELTEIYRQRNLDYRAAVKAMSEGRVVDGLEALDAQGRVLEGGATYLQRAATSFAKRLQRDESALLIAPTWDEIGKLNQLVRRDLIAVDALGATARTLRLIDTDDTPTTPQRRTLGIYSAGMLVSPVRDLKRHGLRRGSWYEIEAVDGAARQLRLAGGVRLDVAHADRMLVGRGVDLEVRPGELLLLHANDRKLGVKNGDRVRVVAMADSGALEVQNLRTKGTLTLPTHYKAFGYAYAVTAEKSQGATVDHAIVAAEKLDPSRTYVSSSRGRLDLEIHVPDKKHLFANLDNQITRREAARDYRTAVRQSRLRESARSPDRMERFISHLKQQVQRVRTWNATRARDSARTL